MLEQQTSDIICKPKGGIVMPKVRKGKNRKKSMSRYTYMYKPKKRRSLTKEEWWKTRKNYICHVRPNKKISQKLKENPKDFLKLLAKFLCDLIFKPVNQDKNPNQYKYKLIDESDKKYRDDTKPNNSNKDTSSSLVNNLYKNTFKPVNQDKESNQDEYISIDELDKHNTDDTKQFSELNRYCF